MPSYTLSVENPDEPDHIASFNQTRIDLGGTENVCFELYKKRHRRFLQCSFETDDPSMRKQTQVFKGDTEKIPTSESSQPTYCVLYINKETREATLRPAVLHTLNADKEKILKKLEARILSEQGLDETIEGDTRTQVQKRSEYTQSYGSKMQKTLMQNADIAKRFESTDFTSQMIVNKMEKMNTEFTTSLGATQSVPERNIKAGSVDKVYEVKKMFPTEVFNDLEIHADTLKDDSDLDFMASYYGEICSYLHTSGCFNLRNESEGTHLNKTERWNLFAMLSLVNRMYKVFVSAKGSRKRTNRYKSSQLEEKLWADFTLSENVKSYISKEFLSYEETSDEYRLPDQSMDKIQAWSLVMVLILSNFKCDFDPFAKFFLTTGNSFKRVVTIVGALFNENSNTIQLKLPLQGINDRLKKRKAN